MRRHFFLLLMLAAVLSVGACSAQETLSSERLPLDQLPRNGAGQPILPETGTLAPGAPTEMR